MIDGNVRHCFGLGQPQVDGDPPPSFCIRLERSPIGNAGTHRTEMKPKRFGANIRSSLARDANALPLVIIGPQHPVATTDAAVARGGGLRHYIQLPMNGTAVASSLKHRRRAYSTPLAGSRPHADAASAFRWPWLP